MQSQWEGRLITAALLLVLLLAYGVAGRIDYDEAQRQREAVRQVRELAMAAQWCGPKPGQRTVQEWQGGRLQCAIYEGQAGYGMAPRLVARMDAPVLSHPLAMGEE